MKTTDLTGHVTAWKPQGFGFIKSKDVRKDVFVHRHAIEEGRDGLVRGQEIVFDLVRSPRGPQATNVRVVKEPRIETRESAEPRPYRERFSKMERFRRCLEATADYMRPVSDPDTIDLVVALTNRFTRFPGLGRAFDDPSERPGVVAETIRDTFGDRADELIERYVGRVVDGVLIADPEHLGLSEKEVEDGMKRESKSLLGSWMDEGGDNVA